MKTFCFYHSADLDGHCSGAIVKRAIPEAELIGINYGDEFDFDMVAGHQVIMVDFSLQPFVEMMVLAERVGELIWIDHHRSVIKEAVDHGLEVPGILDSSGAACEHCWLYYFPGEPMPEAVRLLGRYDVWDHDDPEVLPFQYGMRFYEETRPERNPGLWTMLLDHQMWKDVFDDTMSRGRSALEWERIQNAKRAKACAFEAELDGLDLIAMNHQLTNSKVFDSVWDPEKYHAMCTFGWRKGKWTVSLYSDRDDVDVGEIAKARGGGGHKGAAGFQCEKLPLGYVIPGPSHPHHVVRLI